MDFYECNVIFDDRMLGYPHDLMDPKVLQEKYNTTKDDAWQFVLSISRDEPQFVICVIWTMPTGYELASGLNYAVSYFLVLCLFQKF